MADVRKVFPVEKVLELVTGKADADVYEIASYIVGKTIDNPAHLKVVCPFADAWLARWYPRFLDMELKPDQTWASFVSQAKATLGDHISILPMSGQLKTLANQALAYIDETNESLARQTEAAAKLEKRVKELEPLEASLAAEQKKTAELENRLKTMKTDMGALQRKVNAFDGKTAIDHDELMQNIKDAIKDGLKGITIGAAVADTISSAADADVTQAESGSEPAAEFGFGSSGADADGFGF